MKESIITLTTDFGASGPYAGAMKGVMLGINPGASLVDITHEVPQGDILHGAVVLAAAARYFPRKTIHLAVVDPGVGTKRKPILIETENYVFVGPDNGLLVPAAEADRIRRVVALSNSRYFLPEISPTFHGRDIFGPVAAHLSLGAGPSSFGEPLERYVTPEMPGPTVKDGHIFGEVLYVDTFGNLITNISRLDISTSLPGAAPEDLEVSIKGAYISGLVDTYGVSRSGLTTALFGSTGALEIAVTNGSAAKALGAAPGEHVTVRRAAEGGRR